MSLNKNVQVNYHFMETTENAYFINLQRSMTALLATGEVSGFFNAGENHFLWRIEGTDEITDTDTFLISLVKEKVPGLVRFNDGGIIEDIPTIDGSIGELFYCFLNPTHKFILTLAAGSGMATGNFKKFLNEFSTDGSITLIPLFEDRIDVKVLSWDYYKKVSVSMNFPTYNELADFNITNEGKLLGLVDELGGSKFNITIAAPKPKQVLNAAQLRDTIKNLLANDFCNKLVVRGADWETESLEEYDIKNAQIKYSEEAEIYGSYMSKEEARGILRRAFNNRSKELNPII